MPLPPIGLHQRQTLAQTQTLSPRLQLAVRLLQMSSLDFAQTVTQALDRNPFLEDGDEDGDESQHPDADADGAVAASASSGDSADAFDEPRVPTSDVDEFAAADDRDGDAVNANEEDPLFQSDAYMEDPQRARGENNDGGKNDFSAMDLVANPTSLNAHLHGQLNLLTLAPRDMALAKAIVESLDDDGYFRGDVCELLQAADLDPEVSDAEARTALRRVQSLDPAGVGAANVQECLTLQLRDVEDPAQRELARAIVGEHLKLLAARDTETLAKKLGASQADVEAACARIRRFDPRPGTRYGIPPSHYVTPDVIVKRLRGGWTAMLNPAIVPRVRLNRVVVDLFQQHRGSPCPVMASHLQEARWTLKNVEQRFSTILAVAQAIVDRQRHFLDFGEMAMKPLILREIAEEVGVHESTVSRVTANKYMATPAGVFELKHFFSRAMVMPSGAECSPTAIRGLVRDMIASESRDKPLSDTDITKMLSKQGLKLARRTVTKYRQSLRIEPVNRRKAAAASALA